MDEPAGGVVFSARLEIDGRSTYWMGGPNLPTDDSATEMGRIR